MKVVMAVIVGILVAGSAWARLGETAEEAEKRYGKPIQETDVTSQPGTIVRIYKKGGVSIRTSYYQKDDKMVIGWMFVDVSDLPDAEKKEVITQMLEANSAGQKWETVVSGDKTKNVKRDGATAGYGENGICLELIEWGKWVRDQVDKKKETGSEERRAERRGF